MQCRSWEVGGGYAHPETDGAAMQTLHPRPLSAALADGQLLSSRKWPNFASRKKTKVYLDFYRALVQLLFLDF